MVKNMIVVDTEKCIGCGLCQKDCPAEKIVVREGKAEWSFGCIQCGHCVAICPKGAVSIPEYEMEDVEEFKPETFTVKPGGKIHGNGEKPAGMPFYRTSG